MTQTAPTTSEYSMVDLRDCLGATRLISMVRCAYRMRTYNHEWMKDRTANDFSLDCVRKYSGKGGVPLLSQEKWKDFANKFIIWARDCQKEVELWLAKKSPTNASKLAISYRTRLHDEAEKVIMAKAKDKSGLLEYCTFFAIVLPDLTNVTLKAAFAEGEREKRYIKKLDETKRSLKSFLVQLLNAEQIKPEQTVADLIENLH